MSTFLQALRRKNLDSLPFDSGDDPTTSPKEIPSSAVLPSVTAVNPDHPSMDMTRSRSNGAYIPQGQGPDYTSELNRITSNLESAYAKPQAGVARQVLGALLSRRNPALGAVVSGEAARNREIEPLMNQYKLVSSALQANREANSSGITDKMHQAQTDYLTAHAHSLENPVPKPTSEEQDIADLMKTNNPDTGKPYSHVEASVRRAQLMQDTKPGVAKQAGLEYNEGIPVAYKDANGKTWNLNDPGLPAEGKSLAQTASAAHSQKVKETSDSQARAAAAANQRQQNTFSRQDVTAHDKTYVKPAEDVEKSYQMMDQAYKEYQEARRQGKELPTGAQSMLALSTHLATTFGNVKGARVTKDLIEHHLGARGISDKALVAVQNFTNGDPLAPDQWEAFHDLISKSRKLSWNAAVKEAKRKNIPVDFLPKDLSGLTGESDDKPSATAGLKINRDPNGRIIGIE